MQNFSGVVWNEVLPQLWICDGRLLLGFHGRRDDSHAVRATRRTRTFTSRCSIQRRKLFSPRREPDEIPHEHFLRQRCCAEMPLCGNDARPPRAEHHGTIGPGSVGQSLVSLLFADVFGDIHGFLDMNVFFTDDELRKQAGTMNG